jgi:GDPmannose 4,6-dehydratase
MWMMLQHDEADDYVVATGTTWTVRQFCEMAFGEAGVTLEWRGEGESEVGVDKATGKTRVAIDPRYYRPTEVDLLIGDATKAKEKLGWTPRTSFAELVKLMVQTDVELAAKEAR